MSTVFEAEDGAGQRVALKLLNLALVADPEGRARLRREVATLQRVRGRYVAEVLDAETDEDEAFIVTELIDGPTLEQDVVDSGPYTGSDLRELARFLGEAVANVHAAGVVHRDLKPSNVMLGQDGPVLIDFGIAQGLGESRLTATGSVAQTPGYCDPRVINGESPDAAADWWALAAVLAFAATGRSPFGHGSPHAIMRRVLEGEPDLTNLPAHLAIAFRRALSPSLGTRGTFEDLCLAMNDAGAALTNEAPVSWVPEGAERDSDATCGIPNEGCEVPAKADDHDAVSNEWADEGAATQVLDGVPISVTVSSPTLVVSPPTQILSEPPSIPPAVPSAASILPMNPEVFPDRGDAVAAVAPSAGMEHQDVPEWMRPVPSVSGLAFLGWAAALVIGAKYPVLTLVVLAALMLIFAVVGVNYRDLNRRRAYGGPRRSDVVWVAARSPWTVVKSAVQVVFPLAFAGILGCGAAWFVALVRPMEVAEAVGCVAISSLVGWFLTPMPTVRLGARVVARGIAPSRGYRIFWGVIFFLIAVGAGLYAFGAPGVDWVPLGTPFFVYGG